MFMLTLAQLVFNHTTEQGHDPLCQTMDGIEARPLTGGTNGGTWTCLIFFSLKINYLENKEAAHKPAF